MSHALHRQADLATPYSKQRVFIEPLENRTLLSVSIATIVAPLHHAAVKPAVVAPKAAHLIVHKKAHRLAKSAKAVGLGKKTTALTTATASQAASSAQQNNPVLTSAVSSGSTTTVIGSISSTADKTITIDFYSSPTSSLQSPTYLGTETVTTDSSGNAAINADFTAAVSSGDYITATATTTAMCSASVTSGYSAPILDTATATGSTTGSIADPPTNSIWVGWNNQGAANRYQFM